MTIFVKLPQDKGKQEVIKIAVKNDQRIQYGTPLISLKSGKGEHVLKSKHVGTIHKILVEIGQTVDAGATLIEIEGCKHRVVMKDMCAECGEDLKLSQDKTKSKYKASVSMIPSIPELRVSAQHATEIGNQDKDRLHDLQRLVLLVDLDQTLIHTTQDPGLAAIYQSHDVIHSFQLSKQEPTLYTKLRPHCKEFLEKISKLYELQIVTHGSRQYAHKIAEIMDPSKTLFSHRILSRDECIHPLKKSGNLQHLFPCGDSMVCIIDDRTDVWNSVPNLILVKKYTYFQGIGDINNPHKRNQPAEAPTNIKNPGIVENSLSSSTSETSSSVSTTTSSLKRKSTDEPSEACDSKRSKIPTKNKVELTNETATITSDNKASGSLPCGETNNNAEKDPVSESCLNNAKSDCKTDEEYATDDTELVQSSQSQNSESTGSKELSSRLHGEVSGFSQASEKFASSQDMNTELHDADDYLPCLENILRQIHDTYYDAYEKYKKGEFKDPPDVRGIVPFLKSKVLYGCACVLTSVIPHNYQGRPDQHRAMIAAHQLGAKIEMEVSPATTHLIAGKKGTKKYQDAMKHSHIKHVSPEWLYSCYESWARLPEENYPIINSPSDMNGKDTSSNNTDSSASLTIDKELSEELNVPKYDSVTGKLINKVKDQRFNFKITEIHSRKEGIESAEPPQNRPLYASLIKEDAVVPLVPTPPPSTSVAAMRARKPSMAETVGAEYSLSHDDIVDMDKEVDDLMESSDESSRSNESVSSSSTEDEMAALIEAELDHHDDDK